MSAPSSEEETYSIMFTSLKHPARRKILRMLSKKPMTFSEMLDTLGIVSSHLTYHLESLGELVSKREDGKYRLSTFGQAAIVTMNGVEEVSTGSKYHLPFSLRWKAVFALLAISIILIASISIITYTSLNQLTKEHERLQADFNKIQTENQQLLSWSMSPDKATKVLQDVIQLDLAKYKATLTSNTIERRADLGGVAEEVLKYSLVSNESKVDVVLRFRDKNFSRYQLFIDEGSPLYLQPHTNVLDFTKRLLERYSIYSDTTYIEEMNSLLDTVDQIENMEVTSGNIKLKITTDGNNDGDTEIHWMHTENGLDFSGKGLRLIFENRVLKEMTDGYFLLRVGSTQINVSKEQAIEIARNYAENYTWIAEGEQISDFIILQEPVSAEFAPHPRNEPLELVPYWYVKLHLDKTYPGAVNVIAVGLWADTGEVANIQTLNN